MLIVVLISQQQSVLQTISYVSMVVELSIYGDAVKFQSGKVVIINLCKSNVQVLLNLYQGYQLAGERFRFVFYIRKGRPLRY